MVIEQSESEVGIKPPSLKLRCEVSNEGRVTRDESLIGDAGDQNVLERQPSFFARSSRKLQRKISIKN